MARQRDVSVIRKPASIATPEASFKGYARAGTKYRPYRGADNPKNGHGIRKTWWKTGRPMLRIPLLDPFFAGHKSRRARKHVWVPKDAGQAAIKAASGRRGR